MQWIALYRGANKGLHVLLSRTQAGPGRTVKQELEEISRNHIQTFICPFCMPYCQVSYYPGNPVFILILNIVLSYPVLRKIKCDIDFLFHYSTRRRFCSWAFWLSSHHSSSTRKPCRLPRITTTRRSLEGLKYRFTQPLRILNMFLRAFCISYKAKYVPQGIF